MHKNNWVLLLLFAPLALFSQVISSFTLSDSIRVTIDQPALLKKGGETIIVFFALPNGNTTEWTMGQQLKQGDDWHYDIQHIRAQTEFIRQKANQQNWVVIYLENGYKSWPAWKQRHPAFKQRIPFLIDTLSGLIPAKKKSIYLNGHSGGGSFIFGYLAGVEHIPSQVKRISYLDSDYGYDSSYYPKFRQWLQTVKDASLSVFAYNDSVALYNGKPVVSATGGTWYRSRLLLSHLQQDMVFTHPRSDSLLVYKGLDDRVQFFLKTNPERLIFHTQQVELNGFIHSVLCGTKHDSQGYEYYGPRAYQTLIKPTTF